MTTQIRRASGTRLTSGFLAFRFRCPAVSHSLKARAFGLALLSCGRVAKSQDKIPPPPPPIELARNAVATDPAELQQRRFLQNAVQAVVSLDANGDRTMDAIENSQITLAIDRLEDSSRLAVLCNNGGKALNAFVQSLAGQLHLNGKVSEVGCAGNGRDDDPFAIKLRLHYESGATSLFYESPPELPFVVEKPAEDDSETSSETFDRVESAPGSSSDQPQYEPSEAPPQPVILNPRRSQTSHTVLQLAQGWTPVKLPTSIHADSAFGTVDISVTFADGTLTVDRKLVLKRDRVEIEELSAFQKWSETIERATNVALRSTLYYPDRNASAGTEEQKKAANLIDEAYRDIQGQEFAKAETALNQAEAIDPGHEILHENRGELAAARGDNATSLAEYRKELESFPNALFEMGSIAKAQRKLGDADGAITTLQLWMLADPNSNFAATRLMEQYHQMGRDDLAVHVGDEAVNSMTRDARRGIDFLSTYGREQVLTGQSKNAKTTLEALLDLTVDDRIVNDAAYELSEEGLSLDRAEDSVREALAEFDPENPASALSTSYAYSSIERTNLLLATWDTLGWILYKKGAMEEAEAYVRAAWRSRQDIAISRHLGEILTAEGKPVEAMDVYTLGLAVIDGGNAPAMAKDPDGIAVRGALARLKEEGNKLTVTNPKVALLALRTLDLGAAIKPHGARPYTFTLTKSELVSDASENDGAEEQSPVTDQKLLSKFFPPGSKAALTRKGTIQCSKKCFLVFTP